MLKGGFAYRKEQLRLLESSVILFTCAISLSTAKIDLPPGCHVAPATTITCTGRDMQPKPWSVSHDDQAVVRMRQIYIYGTQWTGLPALANFSRLEGATIYYNDRVEGFGTGTFSNLKALRVLRLTSNKIGSIKAGSFVGLSRLQALDLGANRLASVPADLIRGLRSLRYLHLENNVLEDLPEGLLHDATELRHFDVSGNKLIRLRGNLFENNANLVTVYLRSNRFKQIPLDLFSGITSAGKGSIDLRDNQLTFLPDSLFANLRYSRIVLLLSGNRLACDCSNHWAVRRDQSDSFLACWPNGNGTNLRPISVQKGIPAECGCQKDPKCNIATLPARPSEFIALVGRPASFKVDCTLNIEQVGVSVSFLKSLSKGFSLVGRFRRQVLTTSASSQTQFLFSLGRRSGIMFLALGVSENMLDLFLWPQGGTAQGKASVLDDCKQTALGWKRFIVTVQPIGEGGNLEVTIFINGIRCRVNQSVLGEGLEFGQGSEEKQFVVGGSEEDNQSTRNCFEGDIDRLELYNSPLSPAVGGTFEETPQCQPSFSVSSWCLSPTHTLTDDASASFVPSTMRCTKLGARSNAFRCSTDLTETDCQNVVCHNGGSCTDSFGDAKCSCAAGYGGVSCQERQCRNCSLCPAGRTGPRCLDDIDECNEGEFPCKNLATCHNTFGSFYCACIPGFGGKLCETNVNDCRPESCQAGATCLDLLRDFECVCPQGKNGKSCGDVSPTRCQSKCQNEGLCVVTSVGPRCSCLAGFTGKECGQDLDECLLESHDCDSTSTVCRNIIGSYSCLCHQGYEPNTASNTSCSPVCERGCGRQGSGACIAPGRCDCLPGFGGQSCDFSLCTTSCGNGSQCAGYDECVPVFIPEESDSVSTSPVRTTSTLPTSTTVEYDAPTPSIALDRTSSIDIFLNATQAGNVTEGVPTSGGSKREDLYMIVGILAGVMFVLLILALVTYRQRRQMERRREEDYLAAHAAAVMSSYNTSDRATMATMESSLTLGTLSRTDTMATTAPPLSSPEETTSGFQPTLGTTPENTAPPVMQPRKKSCMVLVHPSSETARQGQFSKRSRPENSSSSAQASALPSARQADLSNSSLEWDAHIERPESFEERFI